MLLSYDLLVTKGSCFGHGWTQNSPRLSHELKDITVLVNGKRGKACLSMEEECHLASRFLQRSTSLYPGCCFEVEEAMVTGSSKELISSMVKHSGAKVEVVPYVKSYSEPSSSEVCAAKGSLGSFEYIHWDSESSQLMKFAPTVFRNIVVVMVGHLSHSVAGLVADHLNDNVFYSFKNDASCSFIVSHKDEGLCILAGKDVSFVAECGKGPGILVKEMQFAFDNLHYWHKKMKFWIKLIP